MTTVDKQLQQAKEAGDEIRAAGLAARIEWLSDMGDEGVAARRAEIIEASSLTDPQKDEALAALDVDLIRKAARPLGDALRVLKNHLACAEDDIETYGPAHDADDDTAEDIEAARKRQAEAAAEATYLKAVIAQLEPIHDEEAHVDEMQKAHQEKVRQVDTVNDQLDHLIQKHRRGGESEADTHHRLCFVEKDRDYLALYDILADVQTPKPKATVQKTGAHEALDRLAKAKGGNYFDAYEAVCAAHPDLAARAVQEG